MGQPTRSQCALMKEGQRNVKLFPRQKLEGHVLVGNAAAHAIAAIRRRRRTTRGCTPLRLLMQLSGRELVLVSSEEFDPMTRAVLDGEC